MSIILASITQDGKSVCIGTDRRSISIDTGNVSEDFVKSFEIKDNLFFAGNGVVSSVKTVKNMLSSKMSIGEMIQIIESANPQIINVKGKEIGHCVFVLAGLDSTKPFIYVRDTKTSQKILLQHKQGRIIYLVATYNNEVAIDLHSYFPTHYKASNDISGAILNTLKRGNEKCHTIGDTFDIKQTSK